MEQTVWEQMWAQRIKIMLLLPSGVHRWSERLAVLEAAEVKPGVTLMRSLLKCHYQPHLSQSKHTHTQNKQTGQVLPAARHHVTLTTRTHRLNRSKQSETKQQQHDGVSWWELQNMSKFHRWRLRFVCLVSMMRWGTMAAASCLSRASCLSCCISVQYMQSFTWF